MRYPNRLEITKDDISISVALRRGGKFQLGTICPIAEALRRLTGRGWVVLSEHATVKSDMREYQSEMPKHYRLSPAARTFIHYHDVYNVATPTVLDPLFELDPAGILCLSPMPQPCDDQPQSSQAESAPDLEPCHTAG